MYETMWTVGISGKPALPIMKPSVSPDGWSRRREISQQTDRGELGETVLIVLTPEAATACIIRLHKGSLRGSFHTAGRESTCQTSLKCSYNRSENPCLYLAIRKRSLTF